MTQQEIEARALELYPERKRQNKKGTGEYDSNLPRRKAYIKGWTDALTARAECRDCAYFLKLEEGYASGLCKAQWDDKDKSTTLTHNPACELFKKKEL